MARKNRQNGPAVAAAAAAAAAAATAPGGSVAAFATGGVTASADGVASSNIDVDKGHEEDPMDVAVNLVLEMVAATHTGETAPAYAKLHRHEVREAIEQAHGDIDTAVGELLSMLTIRAMRLENEDHLASDERARTSKLQWRELCSGLGLSECHAFFKIIETMPEDERDAILSDPKHGGGGFFQQLLLMLDEEELVESRGKVDEDVHPLVVLQRLFPDTKMTVIEEMYERHDGDVNATAVALENIQALDQVQSFASVIRSTTSRSLIKSEEQAHTEQQWHRQSPKVESLGHFPILPSKAQQRRSGKRGPQTLTTLNTFANEQLQRSPQSGVTRANVFNTKINAPSVWGNLSTSPTGTGETKLASQLKIERLQRLLPRIDRDVIQTTFYLNGCSSNATEAALREIFNFPIAEKPPQVPVDDEPITTVPSSSQEQDDPTYTECRARVDGCWHNLSDRYLSALESFNRNHHVIAADRVREISRARRDLRDAQHAAAHAFVGAHEAVIRRHQPVDLHGLTVVEALRVAREVIEMCRAERIRRCILICGVGHHSINQKARLLAAIQLSLERRQIAFRKESGTLYIYPLRSA